MDTLLRSGIKEAVRTLYSVVADDDLLQIQKTRKEFEGDFTLVVFPLLKFPAGHPNKQQGR